MTSSAAIGWVIVRTHRGVTITGSRRTRARTISNDRLPEPTTGPARNSRHGMPLPARIRPTSCRLARWLDRRRPRPRPPRYTMRRTPATRAASAKFRAAIRSSAANAPREPIECTR
jgi:hypothetical protein